MSKKPFLTLLSTAALSAAAALSVPTSALVAAPSSETKAAAKAKVSGDVYIVRLSELPVVAYDGRIKGFAATKLRKGEKIDPNSPAVVNYKGYLESRHDSALASIGGGKKLYSYGYVYNGFAAQLNPEQAVALATKAGVLGVTPDRAMPMDTVTTPTFLGINQPGGIWSQLSGNTNGNPILANGPNSAGAGEGVVVGIVDSGVWPESPSFSDRDANGKLVFQQLPGWNGKCVPGERFTASDCNQKLITARYFKNGAESYLAGIGSSLKGEFPYEFVSARAADGHGVHTASTAAGNYGVPAVVDGLALGAISGIAPRARVAIYKSCWGFAGELNGGCFNSDNVAAIDQAVADGVDVINYSISGTRTNFRDPVEIAFLFAADAGVFVAASAGNSGVTIGTSSVAHPSPWITTVAASTHDRFYAGTVTLGNAAAYTGASLTAPAGPAPVVISDDLGIAGATADEARLCFINKLDPAKVAGKVVVCDRGVNDRVEKSREVKRAGGIGMILTNTSTNTLNADLHSVPTVHLSHLDRPAVRAYALSGSGVTASLSQGSVTTGLVTAPTMASFSSRGPLLAGGGDLLKPDITAPGVDVLAAYSPVQGGHDFEFLQGTSMSSPHVAGMAALFKQRYPNWSPMAIKSALMTTAYQTTKTGTAGQVFGNPFNFGAGHADPNRAVNPGVVFDSSFDDWFGFLCGTQLPTSFCTSAGIPVLDPSNLNVPSIAFGDLPGSQTVTRRMTNVSGEILALTAASSGLAGNTVNIVPQSITINPGQTASVSITVTNASATLNSYTAGAITWTSDKGHTVRIPVVSRPVLMGAPTEVSGSYTVSFGYSGAFSAAARGLVPSIVNSGSISSGETQDFSIVVPAGTTYARFSMFDADVSPASDIDLEVYRNGTLVGGSGSGTSAEEVNFSSPTAGTYVVRVVGYDTRGSAASYKLHSFVLGGTPTGNMTVTAPASATIGTSGTIGLTFSGLTTGSKYLGSVAYSGVSGLPNPTIVRVDR